MGEIGSSARVLGVEFSYPVDGTGEAPLNAEVVKALSDDTTRAIARNSARLPDRERKVALGIVLQFEGAPLAPRGRSRSVFLDR